ncbi:MAG: hypothetical protein AABX38_03770 [Candidatus Micrarchaeota archaeon]
MKIQVTRKENKGYIELPDELASLIDVELFKLKEGYYLLSPVLGNKSIEITNETSYVKLVEQQKTTEIGQAEETLLRKILSIKFENRTPKGVEQFIGENERNTLKILIEKNYINVFKSKKYPDGVYNVQDSVYSLLQKAQERKTDTIQTPEPRILEDKFIQKQTTKQEEQKSTSKSVEQNEKTTPPHTVDVKIIEGERDAIQFSDIYRKQFKAGDLIGIKGFDGKFYVVNKFVYIRYMPLIKSIIEQPTSTDAISKTLNISLDLAKAMLIVMCEKGEAMEKKKGVYVNV